MCLGCITAFGQDFPKYSKLRLKYPQLTKKHIETIVWISSRKNPSHTSRFLSNLAERDQLIPPDTRPTMSRLNSIDHGRNYNYSSSYSISDSSSNNKDKDASAYPEGTKALSATSTKQPTDIHATPLKPQPAIDRQHGAH